MATDAAAMEEVTDRDAGITTEVRGDERHGPLFIDSPALHIRMVSITHYYLMNACVW